MQIHQVRGRNLRDALERARTELGGTAVVISHRATSGGTVTLAVSDEVPRSPGALEALRTQARRVLAAPPRPVAGAPLLADTGDVERCLVRTGCSQTLIDRVCEAVAGRLTEDRHPLDLAAEELTSVFRIARAPRRSGVRTVLAFVGPTGVGKTTTLAKLGLRLARAGRRIALATLDSRRIGALEEARGYGALLGCPVSALREAQDLLSLDARAIEADVVLLDTSGDQERDVRSVAALAQAAEQSDTALRVDVHRVISAASSTSALEAAAAAIEPVALAGCVVTKLDETKQPAPALEHALRERLPIGFLCDGPDLERDFHRASGERFADLLLCGRVG